MATVDYGITRTNGPTILNTTAAGNQNDAAVVATTGGAAIIFFESDGIIAARRVNSAGSPTGSQVSVSAGTGATEPEATRLSNGNVVVTWQDGTGNTKTLGRIYDANLNAVSGILTLDSLDGYALTQPDIAATPDGGFVVVSALNISSTDSDIWTRKFDANGNQTGSNLYQPGSTLDRDPSVAVLANGNIAVAWERQVGSQTEIWRAVYSSTLTGSPIFAPALLDSSGSINQNVSMTARPNGTFTISYSDNFASPSGTGNTNVTTYELNANGTTINYDVTAATAGNNSSPNAATQSDGHTIVVSSDETDGTPWDMRGSLLLANNTVVALDTLLQGGTGYQWKGDIAWVNSSSFQMAYTIWQQASGSDGTSSYGIAVSRFDVYRTIDGDNTSEILIGDGLIDYISASGGNDTLAGLGGNDNLDGGAGIDVAGYLGARSEYQLVKFGPAYELTDLRANSPDGHDSLSNIERISFNGAISSTETFTPRNFNGDLKSDLAWYNDVSGASSVFFMNGTAITGATNVGPANGGSWDLLATGDLNGDAQSDMIWQNATSGDVVGYIMNGTSIASAQLIGSPGSSYKVVGVGDLNADGYSDIVLQDGNGQAVVWLMNGTSIQSAVGIGPANGSAWSVKAVGDLNGDSKADLVWQNTDGSTVGYLMNGGTIVAANQIAGANGTDFSVKGVGDLNGDSKGDIVWQYANGQAGAWLMNGTTITGAQSIGGVNGSQWEIRDLADLNGDAKMDLVWENLNNGQAVGFLMDGVSVIGAANIGSPNGADWKIV